MIVIDKDKIHALLTIVTNDRYNEIKLHIRKDDFVNAYQDFWRHAFDFKGNATRKAYWIPAIINVAIILCGFLISFIAYGASGESAMSTIIVIVSIFMLVIAIPSFSMLVRRFHDTGRNMFMPILYVILSIGLGILSTFYPSGMPNRIIDGISFVLEIYILAITLFPTRCVEPSKRQWI